MVWGHREAVDTLKYQAQQQAKATAASFSLLLQQVAGPTVALGVMAENFPYWEVSASWGCPWGRCCCFCCCLIGGLGVTRSGLCSGCLHDTCTWSRHVGRVGGWVGWWGGCGWWPGCPTPCIQGPSLNGDRELSCAAAGSAGSSTLDAA